VPRFTVGDLLTELFRNHCPTITPPQHRRLKELSRGFGLGLQLTNIIRDIPHDYRRGWSYVPRELCEQVGVSPDKLFADGYGDQSRLVLALLIARARRNLEDGLEYCAGLPRMQVRIRVFCMTSLFFAARTLRLIERKQRLTSEAPRVKMSRTEVYAILAVTALFAPSNRLSRFMYGLCSGVAGPNPGTLPRLSSLPERTRLG